MLGSIQLGKSLLYDAVLSLFKQMGSRLESILLLLGLGQHDSICTAANCTSGTLKCDYDPNSQAWLRCKGAFHYLDSCAPFPFQEWKCHHFSGLSLKRRQSAPFISLFNRFESSSASPISLLMPLWTHANSQIGLVEWKRGERKASSSNS